MTIICKKCGAPMTWPSQECAKCGSTEFKFDRDPDQVKKAMEDAGL